MQPQPASWPVRRIAWWALAAVLAVLWQGRAFLRDLQPPDGIVVDFYQEWASAKNFLGGDDIYEPQRASAARYLGCSPQGDAPFFIEINAHPPTAALLGLPLANLPYPQAVLIWNVMSLAALATSGWLVARELGLPITAWLIMPLIVFLMLGWPVRSHLQQGQLAALLLLLLTGGWLAERSGRERLAGVLIGTAAALKIFPAFLFLHYAFRRQWRVVGAGAVWLGLLTAGTFLLLGPGAFTSYLHEVPPLVAEWRSAWNNASLPALWSKLFDPGTKGSGIVPLVASPLLARALIVASCALVIALAARRAQRAETRAEADRSFGAAIVGMLLLAPVTWEHSFLLLMLPLAVLWAGAPAGSLQRGVVVVLTVMLLVNPAVFYPYCCGTVLQSDGRTFCAAPQVLAVLSMQCYALTSLFALALRACPSEACATIHRPISWQANEEPRKVAA